MGLRVLHPIVGVAGLVAFMASGAVTSGAWSEGFSGTSNRSAHS